MLKTKLNSTIDSTGRIISIIDTTGIYSTSNTTGYNTPNPLISDIEFIRYTLSYIDNSEIAGITLYRNSAMNNTVYPQPSIDDIALGSPVRLTTTDLHLTSLTLGPKSFNDGILDLTMYTCFTEITGVIGDEYTNFITGIDFTDIYNTVDSIIINDNIYNINKTIDNNNYNVLYLIEDLQEDIDGFYPAYRANYKLLNDTGSTRCIQQNTGKVTYGDCNCLNDKEDTLYRLTMYNLWAKYDYDAEDYINANKKLTSSLKTCKSLNCNCG